MQYTHVTLAQTYVYICHAHPINERSSKGFKASNTMLDITWGDIAPYLWNEKKIKRTRVDVEPRFNQVRSYFSDKDFTRANVVLWFELKLEANRSHSTINNLLTIINHYCNYLVYVGKLEHNFMEGFEYYEEDPGQLDVLSDSEFEQLVECKLPRSRDEEYINFRWSLVIEILGVYLFRYSELADLTWADGYDGECFLIRTGKTKTSVSRLEVVPYIREKIAKLRHYKHDYIFGSQRGRLDDDSTSKELQARLKALGINKHISAHSMRRTGITSYMNKDVNRFKLIRLSRHKSFNSLNRYNHLVYQSATEVVETNPLALEHLNDQRIFEAVTRYFESVKRWPRRKGLSIEGNEIVLRIGLKNDGSIEK